MIDAERLARRARELDVPVPVWVEETTSTQDAVRTWGAAQRPEGHALFADHQTEGRGRLGRSWLAPKGQAILLSVLVRPNLPAERLGLLPLAVACAVRTATRGRLGIKWPNDLLAADGRKVAGVLCEADVSGGRVRWVAVGIGVNVHGVPPDVPTAACLDELGPPLFREELAVELVAMTLAWVRQLEKDPERILRAWRAGSCTLGRRVEVGAVSGIARAVDADGALLVRDDAGVDHRIVAGDVRLVFTPEDEAEDSA